MFGFSDYWSQKEEQPTFLNKVAGVATAAAIVAAAVTTSPFTGRIAGRVIKNIASSQKFRYTRFAENTVNESIEGFITGRTSRGFQLLTKGLGDIQQSLASTTIHAARTNAFLTELRGFVKEESRDAFDALVPRLSDHLAPLARQRNLAEAQKILNDGSFLNNFSREVRNIEFDAIVTTNQREVFERIASKTLAPRLEEDVVTRFTSNAAGMSDLIENAIKPTLRKEAARDDFVDSVLRYSETGTMVTLGQLRGTSAEAVALQENVRRYMLRARGMSDSLISEPTAPNPVAELIEYAEEKIERLATVKVGDKTEINQEIREQLRNLLDQQAMGLLVDGHGNVTSLARMRFARERMMKSIGDELQIPLLPFKFNVSVGSLFSFGRVDGDLVKSIGRIAGQTEMRRRGVDDAKAFGLMIGDRVVELSPGASPAEASMRVLEGRFLGYKLRDSVHNRELFQIRSLETENFIEATKQSVRDRGLWGTAVGAVKARNTTSQSWIRKQLYANQGRFGDIGYDRIIDSYGEFFFRGSDELGIHASISMFDNPNSARLDQLHPLDVAEFIMAAPRGIRSADASRALLYSIGEVGRLRMPMADAIRDLWQRVKAAGAVDDIPEVYREHIRRILDGGPEGVGDALDDPHELLRILRSSLGQEQESMFEKTSALHHHAASNLNEAIMSIGSDPDSLFRPTRTFEGTREVIKEEIFGQSGISAQHYNLQRGIYDELFQTLAVNSAKRRGFGEVFTTARANPGVSLLDLAQTDPSLQGAVDSVVGLFGGDEKALRQYIDASFTPTALGHDVFNESRLRVFGPITISGALADTETNLLIRQKALENLSHDVLEISSLTRQAHADVLYDMAEQAELVEGLRARFSHGRSWLPEEDPIAVTSGSRYMVLETNSASPFELAMDPELRRMQFAEQVGRGYGVGDFARSLVDPEAPMGRFAMGLTHLVQMPNALAKSFGLALPHQDQITALRSVAGFMGRRVLPLYVGYEAYKNINANLHWAGLPGIDDLGANALANINLLGANVKDTFGITELNKSFVEHIPGLDAWVSPRSEEEYRDYLVNGEEDVRYARGWFIGNRNPLLGGRVKQIRPNFYRRWKSHWTEAENVDIANPEYSWLPNPLNPLGPLKTLFNPNWWEEKHAVDRPYPTGANLARYYASPRGQLDLQGAWIEINSRSAYGEMAYGTFGRGLPTQMTGGGPGTFDPAGYGSLGGPLGPGYGGGGSSGGYGHGTGGGMGQQSGGSPDGPVGEAIRLSLNKYYEPSQLGRHGGIPVVGSYVEAIRHQSGLYGGVARLLPFHIEGVGVDVQDSRHTHSFARMMWAGEYGEATGIVGEFFRRFIQPPTQDYDAWNPIPNNMPTWLPAKFQRGDPYCVSDDTMVVTDSGLVPAKEIKVGTKIKTHVGQYRDVLNVVRRDVRPKEQVFTLRVSGQPHLTSTFSEEHPLLVDTGEGVEWREVKDVVVGDYVAYPQPPTHDDELEFDLSNIGTWDLVTERHVFRFNNQNISPLYLDLVATLDRGEDPVRFKEILGASRFHRDVKRIEASLSNPSITLPRFIKLDRELGFVIGLALAEASFQSAQTSFALHVSEFPLAERVKKKLVECFGPHSSRWSPLKGTNGASLRVYSKPVQLFLEWCVGKGAKNKSIERLSQLSSEVKRGILEGYFLGDGCSFCTSGRPVVSAKTCNLRLVYQVWEMLLSLGFAASIIHGKPSGPEQSIQNSGSYQVKLSSLEAVRFKREILKEDFEDTARRGSSRFFFRDGYFFTRVEEKTLDSETTTVLGFTVDQDHTFCVPAIATHNTRVPGIGELSLPGDAYERANPKVMPMKIRGSMIGLSEEEMIQKLIQPYGGGDEEGNEHILGFGTRAHLEVQRRLRHYGMLLGAEVQMYDEANNLSATVDAVVRGPDGPEVVEIKTQAPDAFLRGEVPEKYIDQLTLYMHLMKTPRGHLAFMNRDNPQQVRIETIGYSQDRMDAILAKVDRVRGTVQGLVDQGLISPFETYDLVSRIEILAKVAPNSAEFRMAVAEAEKAGGFNGEEGRRYRRALDNARKMQERYRLYPKRHGAPLESNPMSIEGVTDEGEIITGMGVVRIAGIEWDPQAFADKDASEVLAEFGIVPGAKIGMTMLRGQFNRDVMHDVTMPAMVGNLHKRLIESGLANPIANPSNPLDYTALHGRDPASALIENVVHLDTMLTNKLFRVRTGLEEFERGEVFGSNESSWADLWSNYIVPTAHSFVSKHPIIAMGQAGLTASLFVKSRQAKSIVATVAAAVVGIPSLIRHVSDTLGRKPWTPRRYNDRAEFDEYYDILTYLKETSIAETAKELAVTEEGVDIDRLMEADGRVTEPLGPFGTMAIQADRRAKATMYAFDERNDSLGDALAAVPDRHRQIAQSIIETGTLREKQRFYELLPTSEKRVLGRFLGVPTWKLPDKPNLETYFRGKYLPDIDWAGWMRTVDMEDVKTRAAQLEGMKIDKPSRQEVAKARIASKDVPIPRMDRPTSGRIRHHIQRLIEDGPYGNVSVVFSETPANGNSITADFQLLEDQTNDILAELRRQA